jgi:hypothetical protein
MSERLQQVQAVKTGHTWLRSIKVYSAVPEDDPLLDSLIHNLLEHFKRAGHDVQDTPDDQTDLVLTSAPFGEPLGWRQALMFTVRRRYQLKHTPTVLTLLHATPKHFQSLIEHFELALAKDPLQTEDFSFDGLAPQAHEVLIEQGQRRGPMLALERLVQAQAKCIHNLLVIGEEEPEQAYLFNLVGAYPHIPYHEPESFYDDIILRIVTTLSTHEVTNHKALDQPVDELSWKNSPIPRAMRVASQELGKRDFFTAMIRIEDLAQIPAIGDAIANQYSEGCFATWNPELEALIATVTGSARPVDKGNLNDDDLAVIVDLQPDGSGAVVRHVAGKRNDPPSSEAVEMVAMDRALPRISLPEGWEISGEVPVVRSKLHGHRGVSAFDPRFVEHVHLEPAYYHYPVSCATEAQARAIEAAFSRAEALQNPQDPRQVVFTVLPGHGVVIVEKWVAGKSPFQVIWEYMDEGRIVIDSFVPQGPLAYVPDPDAGRILQIPDKKST